MLSKLVAILATVELPMAAQGETQQNEMLPEALLIGQEI
jgi:hypothetical protein